MNSSALLLESVFPRPAPAPRPRPFGAAGDPQTRVLAGPPAASGPEPLVSHLQRLGQLPPAATGLRGLVQSVEASGMLGRGGASFPVARKLRTLLLSGGRPLVVVNASESEPASRKDATLVSLRPHLVLDGAAVLAAATGADEVVIVLHRGASGPRHALERAIAERRPGCADTATISVVVGPDRYVAGESSAIVSLLQGEEAKPRSARQPAAVSGVGGRPTLVHNVETVAQLALLARFGDTWFAQAGSPASPGSMLVTLAGGVAIPGSVLEIVAPVTVGELLAAGGGVRTPPAAVLLGGYGGTWVDGPDASDLAVEHQAFADVGASFGCGLIGVLPSGVCGLRETARLVAYLAGESSGQCGPCAFGLPAVAACMADLAAGTSTSGEVRRMHRQMAAIRGRGACGHPDGVVTLVASALEVFAQEVHAHLRHSGCSRSSDGPVFPLPRPERGWR